VILNLSSNEPPNKIALIFLKRTKLQKYNEALFDLFSITILCKPPDEKISKKGENTSLLNFISRNIVLELEFYILENFFLPKSRNSQYRNFYFILFDARPSQNRCLT